MSKRKNHMPRYVGKTPEGAPVVAGVYRFCETVGVPLTDVLYSLREQGAMVDWLDFYVTAKEAGMKPSRILSKLDEAVSDAYGPEVRDVVVTRLRRVADADCGNTSR